ncbi:MAG: hypothetical protein LBR31_01020 [Desulfovibrio sp.]|jgi:hypothetical protein|nr:hypothetical protein [Desulfovibrio sp.]
MRRSSFVELLVIAVCCLSIVACAKAPRNSAEQARIPAGEVVYVAPFTQPLNTSDLVTGTIPEKQGRVPADMLPELDRTLRNVLTGQTKRAYHWLFSRTPDTSRFHNSEQPQALPRWVEYGRRTGANLLLIPQILDWHERDGSNAGVTRAAHVRVEFFLLDVRRGLLVGRSAYEEEQVGLVDDLLNVATFIRRHGSWVTASVLAEDGMRKAVKDIGL